MAQNQRTTPDAEVTLEAFTVPTPDLSWSLGGEAPGPAYMPTPTPEQSAAIRDELDKAAEAERKSRADAIARGMAKGAKESAAKAQAAADAADEVPGPLDAVRTDPAQ